MTRARLGHEVVMAKESACAAWAGPGAAGTKEKMEEIAQVLSRYTTMGKKKGTAASPNP